MAYLDALREKGNQPRPMPAELQRARAALQRVRVEQRGP
jgi:hypothetical protein